MIEKRDGFNPKDLMKARHHAADVGTHTDGKPIIDANGAPDDSMENDSRFGEVIDRTPGAVRRRLTKGEKYYNRSHGQLYPETHGVTDGTTHDANGNP